jgi:hypothetical protein
MALSKPEDAEAFAERFVGKRLPTGSRGWPLKTVGPPERVVQDERQAAQAAAQQTDFARQIQTSLSSFVLAFRNEVNAG